MEAISTQGYFKINDALNRPKIVRAFIYCGLACLMFGVVGDKLLCIGGLLYLFSPKNWVAVVGLIQRQLVIVSWLLLACIIIGIFYSRTSWHDSFGYFYKYLKLLYSLILAPLFRDKSTRNLAVLSFLVGIIATEALMYLHYFGLVNFGCDSSKHWLFAQDLDSSYIVAFAAFLLANFSMDKIEYRWWTLPLLVLITVDLLFLNQERTAYLIYLGLVGLFLWQRFDWRGLLMAALIVPLLFGGLYLISPKVHVRVNQVVSDIANYQKGNEATSIGLRLTFARYSLAAIKDNSLFGLGTGSFPSVYKAMKGPKLDENAWPAHPHNEYIAILFQLGVVGLVLFCSWLIAQALAVARLQKPERWLAQGLILGFILLSLCNASLQVNPAGNFYAVLLGIFLGGSIPYSKSSVSRHPKELK